ncbi:MAG: tRNA dihydrouridine synthase DusB [Verrucomicrobiales bacterium]|nr:tRNA dihydrouridine synthase DusB [Verrucomicrobiales bacterium]
MLPWLNPSRPPLYLAPMAGVTDVVFRRLCKELGADVMVTEFVSSEGIIRRDDRTRHYTEFDEGQRPVGVQLFGATPENMAEAAKKVVDWKAPDFIDLNFGCPVNKVVAKNGGSSLLRDCPLLTAVATAVAKAVSVPVTAKIRIGWDEKSVNAPQVVRLLEDCGIAAVTIHGRTRAQGYSGQANWEVIAECAEASRLPIIGNGDLACGADVEHRMRTTKVRGLMIGRAAMGYPWVFREARHYLETGTQPEPVPAEDRWAFMLRHCRLAMETGRFINERALVQSLRSRLMAYSKGLPGSRLLRTRFCHVQSMMELEDIAASWIARTGEFAGIHAQEAHPDETEPENALAIV